jgi:dihydropteroate synthase
MGIVNVTPDSFSDGGKHLDREDAIAHGVSLAREGAAIIDVGGESSRPGAEGVTIDLELERVVPVVQELTRQCPGRLVSIDTCKAEVAEASLAAGATIVNDVSAGRDPDMMAVVARHRAAIVLMHMRGDPRSMQRETRYSDVVAEVHSFLAERAAAAEAAGIPRELILVDPGIGFGKDVEGNLRLIAALGDLAALGYGVVVGASRKSFIGTLSGAAVGGRLPGSLAAVAGVVTLPRVVVRVHDVAETIQFLTVLTAIGRQRWIA